MAVMVGSARINENGQISGGQPGDQTGRECDVDNWYLHELGWVCIRAKDAEVREKIALDMEYICENDCIGYDQPRDQTLYRASKPYGFDASKVKEKCDTDCARAVRVCVLFAGIDCPDFYTATEVKALRNTGAFDILKSEKYCESPDYLLRGDILCTKTKGHTVVVLSDGDKSGALPTTAYKIAHCRSCNMRTGGGTEYSIIRSLKDGDKVGLISWSDTGWGQVRYGDWVGYVSPKYLEPDEAANGACSMVATGDVWMRDNAGTLTGKKIRLVKKGETVNGTGATKNVLLTTWYEVVYKDSHGWCSGKYLNAIV